MGMRMNTKFRLKSHRVMDIDEGEYRWFISVHKDGARWTFGFPKDFCPDRRVYCAINREQQEPMTLTAAQRQLGGLFQSAVRPALAAASDCRRRLPAAATPSRACSSLPREKCPKCGKALVRRTGPYGPFHGCSGFPRCRHAEKL